MEHTPDTQALLKRIRVLEAENEILKRRLKPIMTSQEVAAFFGRSLRWVDDQVARGLFSRVDRARFLRCKIEEYANGRG